MKRLLFLWCVFSCLLCGALVLHAWRLHHDYLAKSTALCAAHAICENEIAALRQKIAAAEAEQKAGEQQLPHKGPKKPTELSDKERYDRMMVKMDAEEQNPTIAAYHQAMTRRHYQEEYGDLYRELDLSPETLERFKQLLVEKFAAHSDAAAIVASRGISSFSPEGRTATERAQQIVEHDIESLLGEEKYAAYKEYDRVYRDTVRLEDFQSWLDEKNAGPLDKIQVRVLATACCDVSDKTRNADYAAISDDYWGTTATQQILQRAKDKLTPEQAKAFAEYRAARDAAEKASDAFIRGEAPLETLSQTK